MSKHKKKPPKPESDRPHKWNGERCSNCSIKKSWAGAKYACDGYSNSYVSQLNAKSKAKKKAEQQS